MQEETKKVLKLFGKKINVESSSGAASDPPTSPPKALDNDILKDHPSSPNGNINTHLSSNTLLNSSDSPQESLVSSSSSTSSSVLNEINQAEMLFRNKLLEQKVVNVSNRNEQLTQEVRDLRAELERVKDELKEAKELNQTLQDKLLKAYETIVNQPKSVSSPQLPPPTSHALPPQHPTPLSSSSSSSSSSASVPSISPAERICPYFDTPEGCSNGANCMFRHPDDPSSSSLQESREDNDYEQYEPIPRPSSRKRSYDNYEDNHEYQQQPYQDNGYGYNNHYFDPTPNDHPHYKPHPGYTVTVTGISPPSSPTPNNSANNVPKKRLSVHARLGRASSDSIPPLSAPLPIYQPQPVAAYDDGLADYPPETEHKLDLSLDDLRKRKTKGSFRGGFKQGY